MSLKKLTLTSAICFAFTAPAFAQEVQIETVETPPAQAEMDVTTETETTIEGTEVTTDTTTSVITDLPREDVAGKVEVYSPTSELEVSEGEMASDMEVDLWTEEEEVEDPEAETPELLD